MIKDHIDVNLRGRLLLAAGGVALLSACVQIDTLNADVDATANLDATFSGNSANVAGGNADDGGSYYYDDDYWGAAEEDDVEFGDAEDIFSNSDNIASDIDFADGSSITVEQGQSYWEANPTGTDGVLLRDDSVTTLGKVSNGNWFYGTGTRDGRPVSYYYWEENYTRDPRWMAFILDGSSEVVDIWASSSASVSSSLPTGTVTYSGPTVTTLRGDIQSPQFGSFLLSADFNRQTATITIDADDNSLGGTNIRINPGTGDIEGDLKIYNSAGEEIAPGELIGTISGSYDSEVTGIYYDTIGRSPYLIGGFSGERTR